jgi:phosphate transport system substrate-binding protein
MTDDRNRLSDRVSRRKFIAATGAVGAAGLAGCSGQSSGGDGDSGSGDGDSGGSSGGETETEASGDGESMEGETESSSSSSDTSLLTAEGSSTVYPISNKGSSYWNSNAPPSDGEYWGANSEGSVPGWSELGEPDMLLADYFAQQFGFEPTEQRSEPPFPTTVGLSHSGTGCEAVVDGLVDIGNSSGPITAELDWSEEKANNTVVDNVVGRDGQPVVVSGDVSDAGVSQLTGEQVRAIFQGEVSNWSELEGVDYDQEIFVIGRAEGSGTDTAFRLNMLGDPDAPMEVDTRQGQNQQVAQLVSQNEGAIAYMALAFTSESVIPIGIDFEGTLYEPDPDAENTIFDAEYPLNRDLHMYTLIEEGNPGGGGRDLREAAFINMFLTEFGQVVFVEQNNYIPLPTSDLEEFKSKLEELKA